MLSFDAVFLHSYDLLIQHHKFLLRHNVLMVSCGANHSSCDSYRQTGDETSSLSASPDTLCVPVAISVNYINLWLSYPRSFFDFNRSTLIGDSTRLEVSIVDALEELFAEVVFLLMVTFLHCC